MSDEQAGSTADVPIAIQIEWEHSTWVLPHNIAATSPQPNLVMSLKFITLKEKFTILK